MFGSSDSFLNSEVITGKYGGVSPEECRQKLDGGIFITPFANLDRLITLNV